MAVAMLVISPAYSEAERGVEWFKRTWLRVAARSLIKLKAPAYLHNA